MKRGISQSAITLYRHCPFAFKLNYVDRKQPMYYDSEVMDVGKLVHEAIDTYYKNHYLSGVTSQEILVKSYEALKSKWDLLLPAEDLKKAYDCLVNHSLWEEKNNGGTKPLTEVKIDSNGFYGIIDYIDLNNLKVIDYKTGMYPVLSYEYRMQASVYKSLFEGQFGRELKHFNFFFLYSNEWRTVSFDNDKQKEVDTDVKQLREQIVNSYESGVFEKKPRIASGCKGCEYRFYCKVLE